jgi:hypothetical protein
LKIPNLGVKEAIWIEKFVKIYGEGTGAVITMSPEFVSFDSILIGSSISKEAVITNHSNCTIHYKLEFHGESTRDDMDRIGEIISDGGDYSNSEGKIVHYTIYLLHYLFKR